MSHPIAAIHDLTLLSTDFAPDKGQELILKARVIEDKEVLTALNAELWNLQCRVRELQSGIVEVEQRLKLNQALLSPTRRLPPELLGEIFFNCLPTAEAVITITPDLAPLLLTHVSRLWRRVACGTPRLWVKLYLGGGFTNELHNLVSLWLTNSGALPLE
ncbi:hypothetical protein K439DRAFT_1340842, partial [Ramaria rubella]